MEVLDAIRKRRSVRCYTRKTIGEDAVKKLVEAATWAPSGHRIYAWRMAILEQEDIIERVRSVSPGLHGHPTTLLILCRDRQKEKDAAESWVWRSEAQEKAYEKVVRSFISIKDLVDLLSIMDVAMAALNICLAATDLGIGSCIISVFHPDRIREFLGLPGNVTPQLLVSLGYPKSIPKAPPRRSAEDTVIRWIKRVRGQ